MMVGAEKIDIEWARKHLIGFAKMQDAALAVKASEAEYAKLKRISEEPVSPDLRRLTHPLSPFRAAQGGSSVEQSPARDIWKLASESFGNELLDTPE